MIKLSNYRRVTFYTASIFVAQIPLFELFDVWFGEQNTDVVFPLPGFLDSVKLLCSYFASVLIMVVISSVVFSCFRCFDDEWFFGDDSNSKEI